MSNWKPPTTQEMLAWEAATADIRTEERINAIATARAAKEADGKTFKLTDETKAMGAAKSAIIHRLWNLESVNGVTNPTWGDPVWRGNGETKTETTEEAGPADEKDIIEWARQNLWSDFVTSVTTQYFKKGSLSDKQWASLRGMKAKMDAKAKAKAEVKDAASSDIDLSDLPSGYYSVPDGSTRLKVRVARPTKASRWYGFIFVSDGGEYGARKNYGRQNEGGLYQGEIQDALRAILKDPVAAVTAYGKLTGTCGACGRKLEDADSLERGIGPVCAAKFDI